MKLRIILERHGHLTLVYFCLMTVCCLQHYTCVAQDCSNLPSAVKAFGRNCEYKCRCNDKSDCDSNPENCPCKFGWAGPWCQYKNHIKDYYGYLFTNRGLANKPAHFSLDGNYSTCAKTDIVNGRVRQQSLQIVIIRSVTIARILIHLKEKTAYAFRRFDVEISSDFISNASPGELCYQHSSDEILLTIEAVCIKPIYGSYIKIRIPALGVPLEICEVEILAGREVAFNKLATSSSQHRNYDAQRAVDGLGSTYFASSNSKESFPWWSLDLQSKYVVFAVEIMGRDSTKKKSMDKLRGFSISIGQIRPFTLRDIMQDEVFRDIPFASENMSYYLPIYVPFKEPVTGRMVTIFQRYEKKSGKGSIEFCTVNIYAECATDMCGWHCDIPCFCAQASIPFPNKLDTGHCPDGCRERYTEVVKGNGICEKECPIDRWGINCSQTCGNCSVPGCSVKHGFCGLCDGILTAGHCKTDCEYGLWGSSCLNYCGMCADNDYNCDWHTGHCPNGCEGRWQEPLCTDPCVAGTFGQKCIPCGKCYYPDEQRTPCDVHTGKCESGCEIGWQPPLCIQPCDEGYFGDQCESKCGLCLGGGVCNSLNGTCANETCNDGYLAPKCQQECVDNTYGQNCSENCGHCAGPQQCHHATGQCLYGCKPGWDGFYCNKEVSLAFTFIEGISAGLGLTVLIIFIVVPGTIYWYRRRKERLNKQEGDSTEDLQLEGKQSVVVSQEATEVVRNSQKDFLRNL